MKWLSKDLNPVRIAWCACVTLCFVSMCFCAPQSYYNNNSYYNNYKNHPANRRAAYLNSAYTQNRLPANTNKYHSAYTANAIADPYTTKPTSSVGKAHNNADYYSNNDATKRYEAAKEQAYKSYRNRISQADAENAKFAGAHNQEESDVQESGKTLGHKRLKRLRRLLANRCLPFGRDSSQAQEVSPTSSPDELGRFLWDINVYNVYGGPPGYGGYGGGCSGLLGGGGGGLLGGLGGGVGGGGSGLLSDPIAPVYPISPLNNFLGLFAPGILQNALAATAPPLPPPQADPALYGGNQLQNDPNVDPDYARPPVRRPNQVYFDSAGAPPITPAQLLGGVATTVNGIIQQLTGNIQPVYQQPYG